MPGFNKTGPNGLGPRTGRGFGPCGQGVRRGGGYRMGYGLGCRYQVTAEQEKDVLTENLSYLQGEIKAIQDRIKELGSEK